MAVHEITTERVADFVTAIQSLEQRHIAQWFYRGHSNTEYKLLPSMFRLDTDGAFALWEEIEHYMVSTFKCEATPHLTHTPSDDLEWLALAQHHGLPTRLLDWSRNPLVALYFAVEHNHDINGDVWCLGFPSTNNCLPESTYLARRKTLMLEDVIYFPKHISPRMTNQSGCFTVHDSETPLEEQTDSFWEMTRIHIPATHKTRIINELYELGIHRGFIYPDLDGLTQRIKYEVTAKHFRHTTLTD